MTSWNITLCGESFFASNCAQYIAWTLPAYILLSCLSAYFIGKRRIQYAGFCSSRLRSFRILLAVALFLCPIAKLLVLFYSHLQLSVFDYAFAFLEALCWLLLLGYICSLPLSGCDAQEQLCMVLGLFLCFIASIYELIIAYHSSPNFVVVYTTAFKISLEVLNFGAFTLKIDQPQSQVNLFRRLDPLSAENDSLCDSIDRSYGTDNRESCDVSEKSGLISVILFSWVRPIMDRCYRNTIHAVENLFELPHALEASAVHSKLVLAENMHPEVPVADNRCERQFCVNSEKHISLLKKLHYCFGVEYYSLGILKLFADCLSLAGPMLLNRLVSFLEDGDNRSNVGYYYALALFCATFVGALCSTHYNYLVNRIGLKVRAAVITSVYQKTLSVNQTALSAFTTGEVVNFMSTDSDRIVNFCQSFHQFWILPIQVAITLYLLYQQIGFSFVVGLVFAILIVPLNQYIAKKIGSYSELMMKEKDSRIKLMSEIISGMRVIKMCAWEYIFSSKINFIRKNELKYLKKRKYLDAFCVYFWATSPVIVSFLSFTTYVLLGNVLTASRIFTSVALFNMLIVPLNAFPWVLNGLVEAHISLRRIQKFLFLPELNLEDYYSELETAEHLEFSMSEAVFTCASPKVNHESEEKNKQSCSNSFFERDDNDEEVFHLGPLNVSIRQGAFVCIVGRVGSGKSAFISALLGNIHRMSGTVSFCNSNWKQGIGLVAQEAWIQKASIRSNILFGKAMDSQKYAKVLKACALNEDLKMLPFGDRTEVGEKGVTLSGGQKARIALARALYQDFDLYLLDDPMAAVDVHVADHLLNHCILGLLKTKTRILCTHRVSCLEKADIVVFLENGKILYQGPREIVSQFHAINLEEQCPPVCAESKLDACVKSQVSEDVFSDDQAVPEEEKDSGVVKLRVYKCYWNAVGTCLAILLFLSCFFMQASRTLSDWWLSFWISSLQNSKNSSFQHEMNEGYVMSSISADQGKYTYLIVYASLAAANSCFTIVRAFSFAYCGIKAASVLHKKLKEHILKAPMNFFCVTPLGRILNRFSTDVYNIDDSLPFMLNILLAQTYALLGCLAVTVYSLPWLINVLVPLVMVYHSLQRYYRCTSRELKRLSSVTLSPVYAHFSETLSGRLTINTLGSSYRFQQDNLKMLDANQRAMFAMMSVSQWLNLRLQFMGVIVVTAIAVVALLQNRYGEVDPGLVGLALSYALLLTGLLNGFVTAFTETEKEMVSVERVMQYIDGVPSESYQGLIKLAHIWPDHGVITFKDVCLQYALDAPNALDFVTFQTRPAEKVGIVGRTGSGKSSLIQVLFRVVDINHGQITIDDVDISKLDLISLRSRLSIVPQDPFLFNGSVRENLDPGNAYDDANVWNALRSCHMSQKIEELGGLHAEVEERGQNFSSGERQLMCLARILLHKTKVLCLDEATASVDQQTDSLLQFTLRMAFRNSTVLIIAHRIETIMDCDRVIVMGKGQILEMDQPAVLLANSSSEFYKLVHNVK